MKLIYKTKLLKIAKILTFASGIGENVPNLDAMSKSELLKFYNTYCKPTKEQAFDLLGNLPNGVKWTRLLAIYAKSKIIAMECREEGNIQEALQYERALDELYNTFPEGIRW
jgi:hypothetical protein